MDDPYHKELSALFSSESDALVDEAFVQRCVTSIRRANGRLLAVKLIIACTAAGIVGLVSSPLTELAASVPNSLSAAVAALDSSVGRSIVIGVVLIRTVWRYGFPSFGLRKARP